MCRVERLSKIYDDQIILDDLSFEVHKGDRLAIVGPNGIGKTTLIRLITGLEEADHGRVVWERAMKPSYFNEVMEELDPEETVTKYVNIRGLAFGAQRKQVHRFLALLRFSEMDLLRRIRTLSGGEKARVALAVCLLSGASVIVLDEPTNHLDITTTQAIERALIYFPGAVIVASHDRFFIDKVATRLLVFEGEAQLREVEGNWATWQARMET
jgi:ATP-binding cassette subfamily F protein 3